MGCSPRGPKDLDTTEVTRNLQLETQNLALSSWHTHRKMRKRGNFVSLSLCLSLSPGMCAFAAFPFISLQQSEGKQRKGSKGDKSSRRRGKLTEVRAAASAARQSQGDASLAGAPLLLQSMVASLRCSRNCVDPTLRMPALRSPPTTTLYMWTALNLTLQKHSL